ncbi:MAG: hypothetical protein L6R42_004334, partial [Xanthoria sp. 1 TBL-2021]
GYTPSLVKLPRFLMRLGPCVNWTEEKACFHTFLEELAAFYTPQRLPRTTQEEEVEVEQETSALSNPTSQAEMAQVLEHVLFPAIKARLIATEGMLHGVVEIANLKGLYKVFERC